MLLESTMEWYCGERKKSCPGICCSGLLDFTFRWENEVVKCLHDTFFKKRTVYSLKLSCGGVEAGCNAACVFKRGSERSAKQRPREKHRVRGGAIAR